MFYRADDSPLLRGLYQVGSLVPVGPINMASLLRTLLDFYLPPLNVENFVCVGVIPLFPYLAVSPPSLAGSLPLGAMQKRA